MKQLVWSILLFCIVTAKALEVLGNNEDLMPGEVSSFIKHVRKARDLTFIEEQEPTMSWVDIVNTMMRYSFPLPTTDVPVEPSTTTCATTEVPTSTEPMYQQILDFPKDRTVMNDVIIPIIDDIVNDEETLENITRLFQVTVETILPLATEVLKASSNSYVPGKNAEIKIRREIVESTFYKLLNESVPLLIKIVKSRLGYWMALLMYNTRTIFKSELEMQHRNDSKFEEFSSKSLELYQKYRDAYWNSTDEFIHTYSIVEIQHDIESLFEVFSENSRELFRKNMLILQDVAGIDTNTIRNMIRDIPGYDDVIAAIPPQYIIHLLLLFI